MKTFIGEVISTRMQKTAVVMVQRTKLNTKLNKFFRFRKTFKAHDEESVCNTGDQVRIRISRPYSKTKTWVVEEVLRKNPAVVYQQKMANRTYSTFGPTTSVCNAVHAQSIGGR